MPRGTPVPHVIHSSTVVGDLFTPAVDLVTVQKLLRHTNVQTTAQYDRRGDRANKGAAGMLHVPYRRGGVR